MPYFNKSFSLKKKITFSIVSLIIFLSVTSYFASSLLVQSRATDELKMRSKNILGGLVSTLDDYTITSQATAKIIRQVPEISSGLQQYYQSGESNRLYLLQLLARLKQDINVDILEVADKKAIILAKGQNTSSYGDDRSEDILQLRGLSDVPSTLIGVEPSTGKIAIRSIEPIKVEGKPTLGTITAGYALDEKMLDSLKQKLDCEIFLLSDSQLLVTSLKPDKEHQKEKIIFPASLIKKYVIDSQTDKPYTTTLKLYGKPYSISFVNLRLDRSHATLQQNYIIAVALSEGLIAKTKRENASVLAIIGILSCIIAILIAFFLSRNITRPINALVAGTKQVSNGNLNYNIAVTSNDEIAILGNAFNSMLKSIRAMIHNTSTASEEISAMGQQLAAASTESSINIERIATAMMQVAEGSSEQLDKIEIALQNLARMSASIHSISACAYDGAKYSNLTAEKAAAGGEAVEKSMHKMIEIKDAVENSASIVQGLADKSSQIGQIIDSILNIADQTNLLAINASIEAARAGDHGQGFAVVAEEVRKLATESMESANEITSIIKEILNGVNHTVVAMKVGTQKVSEGSEVAKSALESLNDIVQHIRETDEIIRNIAKSTEEQVIGSNEQLIVELVASINAVKDVSLMNNANAQQIAASIDEQNVTSHEISQATSRLANLAAELMEQLPTSL